MSLDLMTSKIVIRKNLSKLYNIQTNQYHVVTYLVYPGIQNINHDLSKSSR